MQLVRPTKVCGKVLREKNGYKSVRSALLLSNVIDVDHQNQTKAIFHHLYGFYLVFLLNFMSNTLPVALARLMEYISTINSVLFYPCDHYAACWVTLNV